jgi:hypothetical protein
MAEKRMPKGKSALKATAVSLALTALQNEEVQKRLKAAGSEAFGWLRDHGQAIPDAGAITGAAKRTTRQGRLELRLERLVDAEAKLRAVGTAGPRLDWLSQTLAEADTVLTIARSLPRDKRRQAQATVDASLTEIEDALFAAVKLPGR